MINVMYRLIETLFFCIDRDKRQIKKMSTIQIEKTNKKIYWFNLNMIRNQLRLIFNIQNKLKIYEEIYFGKMRRFYFFSYDRGQR